MVNMEQFLVMQMNISLFTMRKVLFYQAWWFMPILPVFGRMRQDGSKFEASLGYIGRPSLKKTPNLFYSGAG
jgi:hypothetical protein